MRSFLFIGDPKDKVEEWLDGEHKVLVIAPAADHDSTNRAIVTLQAAGLEHEIVKIVILDEEYVFGEGKLDEYLQTSTKQTHYPYIFINKEFVGDHRTIAYMDYQGTLMNTVGLVFMVPQSSSGDPGSSRHPSSNQVEKPEEDEEEEEKEENIFAEDPEIVAAEGEASVKGSVKDSVKGSEKGSVRSGSKVPTPVGSASPVHSCFPKSGSVQGSDRTGNTPYKSIVPTPDTIGEPGCCFCCACDTDSPSPVQEVPPVQLCAACNKAVETAEKGTETADLAEGGEETPGYIS